MSDVYLAILVAYLAAIGVSMTWSVFKGRGHTFGWWDGGLLLHGRTLSQAATTVVLLLVVSLVGAGLFFVLE